MNFWQTILFIFIGINLLDLIFAIEFFEKTVEDLFDKDLNLYQVICMIISFPLTLILIMIYLIKKLKNVKIMKKKDNN